MPANATFCVRVGGFVCREPRAFWVEGLQGVRRACGCAEANEPAPIFLMQGQQSPKMMPSLPRRCACHAPRGPPTPAPPAVSRPQTRSGEPMCTGSFLRSNLACAQVAPRAGTIAAGSSPRAAWDRPCRRRAAAVSKDGVSSAVLWASSTAGVSAGRSKVPGADENAPKSSRRSRR